jgi:hypothetical protein
MLYQAGRDSNVFPDTFLLQTYGSKVTMVWTVFVVLTLMLVSYFLPTHTVSLPGCSSVVKVR